MTEFWLAEELAEEMSATSGSGRENVLNSRQYCLSALRTSAEGVGEQGSGLLPIFVNNVSVERSPLVGLWVPLCYTGRVE